MSDLAELDRKVAEAQGWKIFIDKRYADRDKWVDSDNLTSVIYADTYHPTTNKAQAVDLQIKYGVAVWQYPPLIGNWHTEISENIFEKNNKTEASASTPMIAICKAIIASKEG